jgi:hypothetical protein
MRTWVGPPQLTAAVAPSHILLVNDQPPKADGDSGGTICPSVKRSLSQETQLKAPDSTTIRHAKARGRVTPYAVIVLAAFLLSYGTLLLARRSFQRYVEEEVATDARDSLGLSNAGLHRAETALKRKADLLAILVALTPANDSLRQHSIDDPLVREGSDLVALTDGANRVIALHTSNRRLTTVVAEELLLRSIHKGHTSDWWYVDGNLYQVVLQPVSREPLAQGRLGTVIVGRQTDYGTVQDFVGLSGTQEALSYGGDVVASTLNSFDRYELAQKLKDLSVSPLMQIGQQPFYASYENLTDDSQPVVRLIVLKSYRQATAFLDRLNRFLIRLKDLILIIALGFPIFIALDTRYRSRLFPLSFERRPETAAITSPQWMPDEIAQISKNWNRKLLAARNRGARWVLDHRPTPPGRND